MMDGFMGLFLGYTSRKKNAHGFIHNFPLADKLEIWFTRRKLTEKNLFEYFPQFRLVLSFSTTLFFVIFDLPNFLMTKRSSSYLEIVTN
jgi:hypothetical protein